MIVVDADLLLKLVADRDDRARQLFLADPDWIAPPLWRSDFRGALARRINRGQITPERALRAYEAACLIINGQESEPEAHAVLELATSAGLDGYDAEYVAVAQLLGLRYVTADRDLATLAPGVANLLGATSI